MPVTTAPATPSPANRSCKNCPSFLTTAKQNATIGASFGHPTCGTRLISIGRPKQDTGKPVDELVAERCPDYDKPFTIDPEVRRKNLTIEVAMPQPSGKTRHGYVNSCIDCENYVTPGVMLTLTGWNAGMCRAHGELLLQDRLGQYARDCPDRSLAHSPMPALDEDGRIGKGLGIVLLPEYQDGYGRKVLRPVDLLRDRPEEADSYESWHPVSAAYARKGVRAWRRIVDPEGFGPDLEMPIFAKEFFPESELHKIPRSGDQERPEDYVDHAGLVYKVTAMWEMDETPAVWGPAGVGKTELFRYIAWLMGAPFERISITNTSEIDDLAGKMMFTPEKGTYFQYGRIPRAWTKTNVLVLDEPNAGPPEVWQFIRPLTDNSKQLVLDQADAARLARDWGCYFGMAMNPAWDPRNSGITTLADADGSRLMHIFLDLPPEPIERAIISKALQRDKWEESDIKRAVDLLMLCAQDLRTLSADSVIPVSWGIRTQLKVAKAMKYFSPVHAFRVGIADALDPSNEGAALLDAVKSRIGE